MVIVRVTVKVRATFRVRVSDHIVGELKPWCK